MDQPQQQRQEQQQSTPNELPKLDLPVPTLPKGGGAIRGIGEKHSVNPARGTFSLSVPIAITPGRSGFGPQLALSYDTGAGNSPFGLGWSLPVPAIARKTDKGLPRYIDADTFVISGAEDLVPVGGGRYRSRVESAFSRVERVGDHWRSVSRDNITSVYGKTARIEDGDRVFSWLLDETHDDRGNVATYEYIKDGRQLYLSKIRYCQHLLIEFEYSLRPDPFCTHRPGFEVRTAKRCTRIAMYHDFPVEFGDGPNPRLIRSTTLDYDDDPAGVHLLSVTQSGHVWHSGAYQTESLPPLQFEYTVSAPEDVVRGVAAEHLPYGVTPPAYQWADLDGEGIVGALSQQGGAWFYQRNLGDGRMGGLEVVSAQPFPAEASVSLVDIAGDGILSLVRRGPVLHGFQERTGDSWAPLREFRERPVLAWDDPQLRQVDLDGDGIADLLVMDGAEFRWHPSLGRDGYGPEHRSTGGPLLVRASASETVLLADMCGDGLADLVRVRSGEVCYWPNLGYGRFGAKVTMLGAPVFDHEDQFDPQRLRTADIDGSGTTDILYIGRRGVMYWINQSGNGFGPPIQLKAAPGTDRLEHIEVADLLGTGTSCLVWSQPLPSDRDSPLRYVDLCQRKGNLLHRIVNNLGSEIRVAYASSTHFYLEDRKAGTAWATRLHFPVQVVAQVTSFDHIAKTSLSTSYRYRNGYYDAAEREFRGFGFVERTDSETFPLFSQAGATELHRPPARTRTWFHLGIEAQDMMIEPGLSALEHREALRALAGMALRTELYADDGVSDAPFTVTVHRYQVHLLHPASGGGHAVFRHHVLETVSRRYERDLGDPRVSQELVVETDDYNTVRRRVTIGYPRKVAQIAEQAKRAVVRTEHTVTHVDTAQTLRLAVPVETTTYEMDLPAPAAELYTVQEAGASAPARLIKHMRTRYWSDDLTAPLPVGQAGLRALTHHTLQIAFTPAMLASDYSGKVTDAMLAEGGHVFEDGAWWIPSGVLHHEPAAFYLPVKHTSPFGNESTVEYDAYKLLPVESRQSLTAPYDVLVTSVVNDYRMLCPVQATDPNGNTIKVALDAVGRVRATWVRGKDGEGDPDGLPGAEFTYHTASLPSWAQARQRERHSDAGSPWRVGKTYSDGTGRVVLSKQQATPDSNGLRWIGSGRTVFDNKGRPVKQYEPYFSATDAYEDEPDIVMQGVTPILHYDPVGRLVRTDHPDGTFSRVDIGPWQSESWDANDTVLDSLWFAERGSPDPTGPEPGDPEQRAAWLAAKHAGTPAVSRMDSLGRAVRAIADAGPQGLLETVSELDIEGRVLSVADPRGIVVQTAVYDLAGQVLKKHGPDSGNRLTLPDIAGTPIWAWDELHVFHSEFDPLRRPLRTVVAPQTNPAQQRVVTAVWHGEAHLSGFARNLFGRVAVNLDEAGLVTAVEHDFKGNLRVGRRRLLANPATDVDWGGLETVAVADVEGTVGTVLESEVHQSATDFDAISRPVIAVAPDGSVTELSYNEAGRLDTVQVNQELYVRELDYDAKGQRRFIVYGNFVRTRYTYDKLSYRLTRLETFRSNAPNQPLQDLSYTYDPVGNVVEIRDHAQQTHFYAGLMTQPVTRYAYDPLYRLVSASGREHDSLQSGHTDPAFGKPIAHPNDANKLRPYTQTYAYDPSGNLTQMQHSAGPTGSWTRTCLYAVNSNRLLEAGGSFGYDAHGNMTGMPHLPGSLGWDHADRLFTVHMLGGGTGRYTYDNTGQRIRKTLVRNGGLVEERVYLGPFEIHRRSQAGTETFRRNTLHVMDDQSRIALIETDTGSNATRVRYQFGNHLGSCALEVDNSVAAKIISYEEYHPFGTTSAWLGANDIEASERRYRYTGKEKDEETALYYHGARYYAPWLGRWTAADPVGMKAGTNVYAYVRNNPVRLHDPSGTDGKKPPVWHEVLTEDKGAKYYMREDAGAYGRETGQFREAWVDYGPQEVQFKGGVIIGSRSKPITKAEAEKKVDPKEVAKEWAKEEMAKKALEEAQRKVDEALEEAARQAEEEEAAKAEKEGMLDSLQTTLDVAGLVPGFGEVADVLNAGVSLARGDYTGAAMSLAAAVPLAGGVAAAAKLTRKAFKAHAHAERTIKAAELINKGVKLAGKEADAAEDAAALLRSGLSKSEAGSFYHEAVGLAGSGGGADLVGKGWQKEVKTHFGPMYDWQFKSVEPQSQWYSHVYSHANRAPDGSPLYPIRIVEQVYIDPTTGFGIKFMY